MSPHLIVCEMGIFYGEFFYFWYLRIPKPNNMDFPVLHTSRLDLIEIRQIHLTDLFDLFRDEEVVRYYNLLPYTCPDEGQKFIDWYSNRFVEDAAIRWGIALKGEKTIIGTLGFNNYTKYHRANIGYDLQRKYWGNGYMKEALQEVIDFGFGTLGINRIEAEVMQGNIASERLLRRLGFTKEGVLRQWLFWNERYYDMGMYSLLKSDR